MAMRFIWYDLMTTDAGAAAGFYHGVLGWKTTDASSPGGPLARRMHRGRWALGGLCSGLLQCRSRCGCTPFTQRG
jgi:predicted enzyme related to lactoylglutathione lyase